MVGVVATDVPCFDPVRTIAYLIHSRHSLVLFVKT